MSVDMLVALKVVLKAGPLADKMAVQLVVVKVVQ